MKEEIKKILKMVEEGKISFSDAQKLIDAILETQKEKFSGKFLKIKAQDKEGDEVNITLPVGLLKFATKFIPKEIKENLKEKNVEIDEILSMIKEAAEGEIINVQDKDGSYVKIWVE